MHLKPSLVFYCLLGVIIILLGCGNKNFGVSNKIPIAFGKLDIDNYNLLEEPPLLLNGEWEFYWNKLLTPDDFSDNSSLQPDAIVPFPSYWNNLKIEGKDVEAYGYATYRLQISNAPPNEVLAIKMRNAMTSYKLWINNDLLLENGTVGTNKQSSIPGFYPEIQSFILPSSTLMITLQISNYSHAKGGIRGDIFIGEVSKIVQIRERNIMLDIFLIGAIFIMSIYHFGLYYLLRKDVSTLFFGLLCLSVVLRIACTGEIVINNYFNVPWELLQKIEYMTYVVTVPTFLLYLKALYPKQINKAIINGFVLVAAILLTLIVSFPSSIYSHIATPYQFVIIIGGIYIGYVLLKAITNEKERSSESYIFLAGYVVLFLAVIYDVTYYNFISQYGNLSPLGLFVFIFSQSFILSKRFSAAFKIVEDYNRSLKQKVKERTNELEFKNDNLRQLDKEKDGMIDIVAHDLKSPFNTILGFAELLKLSGSLDISQRDHVQQIEKIVGTGKNLIRDILDMHAYDHDNFKLNNQRVELDNFVKDWQKRYQHLLSMKNLELISNIKENTILVVDKELLTRIMDNLMTNAIKFSQENKSIWITSDNLDTKLKITVKDEGPGISEEDKALMFKPFQKLSAKPTAGEASNGLGLAIIKSLITRLGGEIKVESTLDFGSSFTITLPINIASD